MNNNSNQYNDIIHQLQQGAYECSVCCQPITFKDSPELWWCERCFNQILHRQCAKKWALSRIAPFDIAASASSASTSSSASSVSASSSFCPNCRASLSESSHPTIDLLLLGGSSSTGAVSCGCYCGKVKSHLKIDPSIPIPGSCGEQCPRDVIMRKKKEKKIQKKTKENDDIDDDDELFYFCPHPCEVPFCHPGPCPPCKALRTIHCRCGKGESKQIVCGDYRGKEFYNCGQVCGALFPCGIHRCQEICCGTHPHRRQKDSNTNSSSSSSSLSLCGFTVKRSCRCGKQEREYSCGTSTSAHDNTIINSTSTSSVSFSCNLVCGKKFKCGVHSCSRICCTLSDEEHSKMLCDRDPENEKGVPCNCGKTLVVDSDGTHNKRTSCTDPLPGCVAKICGKQLNCQQPNHLCTKPCHDEDEPCSYCFEKVKLTCACARTIQIQSLCFVNYLPQELWSKVMDEYSNAKKINDDTDIVKTEKNNNKNDDDDDDDDLFSGFAALAKSKHKNKTKGGNNNNNKKASSSSSVSAPSQTVELPTSWPLKCNTKCNTTLNCGKHVCEEICCPYNKNNNNNDHPICPRTCKKLLSCRLHECNRPCHGTTSCKPCPNESYDPLYCTCRKTMIDPPVPCGTLPPSCNHPCSLSSRGDSTCGHGNNNKYNHHACHSRNVECPPCQVPVQASCYSHGLPLDWLVPCYRSKSVSCGKKCGKQCPKCVQEEEEEEEKKRGRGKDDDDDDDHDTSFDVGTCEKVCHKSSAENKSSLCVCSRCKHKWVG